MFKQVSELAEGQCFVYQNAIYEAGDGWRDETSTRLCKKLGFEVNGEWYTSSGEEWFNWYCEVQLVKFVIQRL